MSKILSATLLAHALSMIPASVAALTVGSAGMNGGGYILIDLNPTDGIMPSVSFNDIAIQVRSSMTILSPSEYVSTATVNSADFKALSAYSLIPLQFAANSSSLYAGGVLGQLAAAAQLNENGSFRTGANLAFSFNLGPLTEIQFFGQLTTYAQSVTGPLIGSQFSVSSANIVFSPPLSGGTAFTSNSDASDGSPLSTASNRTPFMYTFSNTSNIGYAGAVSIATDIYSRNLNVSPIPEPKVFILLPLGILMLSLILKYRNV